MNNFEIKEALRGGGHALAYAATMKRLHDMLWTGEITAEVFGVRAASYTREFTLHYCTADMLASRMRTLLDNVETEGMRISSLKPERREGFMEPFWVDGHWKFTPKLGHDHEGKPIA